jgi:hypothetical protein
MLQAVIYLGPYLKEYQISLAEIQTVGCNTRHNNTWKERLRLAEAPQNITSTEIVIMRSKVRYDVTAWMEDSLAVGLGSPRFATAHAAVQSTARWE